MVPLVGLSSAPSNESNVLLPLPLRPTTAAKTPVGTVKLTPSTAFTSVSPEPNVFERSVTCSMTTPSS